MERRFIEGVAKLVFKQIVGGGGDKCVWEQVGEEHGVHFRPREQQVPDTGVGGRAGWDKAE